MDVALEHARADDDPERARRVCPPTGTVTWIAGAVKPVSPAISAAVA
jgi:hypothetical protein